MDFYVKFLMLILKFSSGVLMEDCSAQKILNMFMIFVAMCNMGNTLKR